MSDNAVPRPAIRVTVTVRFPGAPDPAASEGHTCRRVARPSRPEDRERPGLDAGFDLGLEVGCALGRRLEALRWANDLERWRRLVRWTARQGDAA